MTQVSDELRVVESFPPLGSDLPDPIRAEIAGDGEAPRAVAAVDGLRPRGVRRSVLFDPVLSCRQRSGG